jgi:hypothetical protein
MQPLMVLQVQERASGIAFANPLWGGSLEPLSVLPQYHKTLLNNRHHGHSKYHGCGTLQNPQRVKMIVTGGVDVVKTNTIIDLADQLYRYCYELG